MVVERTFTVIYHATTHIRIHIQIPAETSPHTVAGMLQRFLSMLPEPVVPPSLFELLCDAVTGGVSANELRAIINRVPASSRYVLNRLMRLLGAVSDHSAETLMTVRNLASIFTPSLLRHTDDMVNLKRMKEAIGVVEQLIEQRGTVFGSRCASHPKQ